MNKAYINNIIDEIEDLGIKKWLDEYILKHSKLHGLIKLFKNPELSIYLNVDGDLTIAEKLYCTYNNLSAPDNNCNITTCSSTTRFISFKKGYKKYCSKSCQNKNPDLRKSISNSLKSFHSKAQKEFYNKRNTKMVSTNNEKYGTDYPIQNKDVRSKIEATLLNNYGVKHNFQIEDSIRRFN